MTHRDRFWCRTVRLLAFSLAPMVLSCGGGGGTPAKSIVTSGNRPPVAAPPTCSDVVVQQRTTRGISAGPGILVPETTISRAGDAGLRAHTNHLIRVSSSSSRDVGPDGLSPQQVATAYGVPTPLTGGSGAIAVVDAFDYPPALSDFNLFSSTFGLPQETSAIATASTNQVFQVFYATGTVPKANGSWAQEMAGDIEWVHAMAPAAKIYLVEAASDQIPDIMAAVAVAKSLPGVREVSISFGSSETGCSFVNYDSFFLQSGVVFFAASGDDPGERDYPAVSSNVVAVGGTSLTLNPNNTWASETVWDETGCGPSSFEPRPVFQDSLYSTIGLYRGACDIAALADPNNGVSVYDSYPFEGSTGWFVAGGTSVATPILAGITNASGATLASSQAFNTLLYANAGSQYFHPITSGSAGGFSAGAPWCFPTGLGTPNGLGALLSGNASAARRAR